MLLTVTSSFIIATRHTGAPANALQSFLLLLCAPVVSDVHQHPPVPSVVMEYFGILIFLFCLRLSGMSEEPSRNKTKPEIVTKHKLRERQSGN